VGARAANGATWCGRGALLQYCKSYLAQGDLGAAAAHLQKGWQGDDVILAGD
jgi:hypothetical protein